MNRRSEKIVAIGNTILGLSVLAFFFHSYWFYWFGISGDLYNCEPMYEITSCKVSSPGFSNIYLDCILTNRAQVTISANETPVWGYDSDGILIDTHTISAPATVPPGRSTHIDITLKSKASRSVICSMDPTSQLIDQSMLKKI